MSNIVQKEIKKSIYDMKIIGLSIFILLIIGLSITKIVDKNAYESNISSAKEVGAYLVTTRGINAILSVIQNSSVNMGIGVNVEIAAGQVVNPLNDFLDRFSWILLFSLISLGIQKLILILIETNILTIFLIIFGSLTIFGKIYSKYDNKIFIKLFLLFTFIRLSVPFMEISNSYIYNTMMKKELQTIQTKMHSMEKELKTLLPTQNNVKKLKIEKEIKALEIKKEELISKNSQGLLDKYKSSLFNSYSDFTKADKTKVKQIDKEILQKQEALKKLDISISTQFEIAITKIDTLSDIYFEEAYNAIFMFLLRSIFFPIVFLYFFARSLKIISQEY